MKTASVLGFGMLLFVAAAASQEPRGGGRGGPGGFFFGAGAGPASNSSLLGMPEVQTELSLNDTQRNEIQQLLERLQEQLSVPFREINFQELAELPEEQRRARFDEVRKRNDEVTARFDEQLNKILDAAQRLRIGQLRLQRDGVDAFGRPEVTRQLGLGADQEPQIREIIDSTRPRFDVFGPPDLARMGEQRRQALSDALALLSDAQRAKWANMVGGEFKFPEPMFPAPPGGPGFGPGGPMGATRKILSEFDRDGNHMLDKDERQAAREALKAQPQGRQGPRGGFSPGGFGPGGPMSGRAPGPPGFGRRGDQPTPEPGAHIEPSGVKSYPDAALYEPSILRTLFLNFENSDWEAELQEFHGTDVDVPATLTVDGTTYPNVGVHFRGMSSYMGVAPGYKRSLNVSLDLADSAQRLYGYKTLNLLNSHEDPSFLSTVLYSHIARQFMPAPRSNFVRVVINGENWGVYVNVQQFNKEFTEENYKDSKGQRWKVRGNPGADGGLRYLGDNVDDYKQRFELKSNGGEKAWKSLIALCRTLNQTPLDELEAAAAPILDIDEVLWFLALDVALINNDGYWVRASDYSIYLDSGGKFHMIPSDMNEAFHGAMPFGFGPGGPGGPGRNDRGPGPGRRPGPGGSGAGPPGRGPGVAAGAQGNPIQIPGGGPVGPNFGGPPNNGPRGQGGGPPRGAGVQLDPLVGIEDPREPLRSRLLAVPSLRAKYLDHIRTIAEKSLDWTELQPVVDQYRSLIENELRADTRKLSSLEEFETALGQPPAGPEPVASEPPGPGPGGRRPMPLRSFVEQRRNYLLAYQRKE